MNSRQHDLPSSGGPEFSSGGDARAVARMLHKAGPLDITELRDQPELADWSAARVEDAVVCAWSDNLIFIDTGDHLVAI